METHRKGFAAPVKSKLEELFMTLHTMCNKVRFLGIFPTPPKHHSEIVASKFSHNSGSFSWTVEQWRRKDGKNPFGRGVSLRKFFRKVFED